MGWVFCLFSHCSEGYLRFPLFTNIHFPNSIWISRTRVKPPESDEVFLSAKHRDIILRWSNMGSGWAFSDLWRNNTASKSRGIINGLPTVYSKNSVHKSSFKSCNIRQNRLWVSSFLLVQDYRINFQFTLDIKKAAILSCFRIASKLLYTSNASTRSLLRQ